MSKPIECAVSIKTHWCPSGKLQVKFSHAESVIHADTVEPGNAESLEIFIDRIREKLPGIDCDAVRELVLAKLELRRGPQHYFATSEGLFYNKPTNDGFREMQLTNFPATITSEITRDDGVEMSKVFEIEVHLQEQKQHLQVPASEFSSMNWVITKLGAGAIILPGTVLRP